MGPTTSPALTGDTAANAPLLQLSQPKDVRHEKGNPTAMPSLRLPTGVYLGQAVVEGAGRARVAVLASAGPGRLTRAATSVTRVSGRQRNRWHRPQATAVPRQVNSQVGSAFNAATTHAGSPIAPHRQLEVAAFPTGSLPAPTLWGPATARTTSRNDFGEPPHGVNRAANTKTISVT